MVCERYGREVPMPSAKQLAKKKAREIAQRKETKERGFQPVAIKGSRKDALKCRKDRNKRNKRGKRR
jgi:hypothetical protein